VVIRAVLVSNNTIIIALLGSGHSEYRSLVCISSARMTLHQGCWNFWNTRSLSGNLN